MGLGCGVSVNNRLISTNLYPPIEAPMMETLRDHCIARWSTSALWFRSLNWVQHGPWLDALIAAGFQLSPTRQVYLFQDLNTSCSKDLRRDLALMRKTALQPVAHHEFEPADFARSERLYAQLYLEKYSAEYQYTAQTGNQLGKATRLCQSRSNTLRGSKCGWQRRHGLVGR